MRIARIMHLGLPRLAAFEGEVFRLLDVGPDLAALLRDGADPRSVPDEGAVSANDVERVLAPLHPGKIVAIGLNYLDHVRESGVDPPARPLVFAKFPSSVIGAQDEIVIDPAVTERVDWEVELAVVVGRRMRSISVDRALDYVFGWTVANDVSARDLQFSDGQWVRGKSLDTFCPVGPEIVTTDEIPNPQALELETRVNGEVMQQSSTASMIFSVAEILAFCSTSFSLDPGDLVLTGTPWGCGEFMSPKRSMQHGDLVECEIKGIGKLANRVVVGQGDA